jgi:hypothetical protein
VVKIGHIAIVSFFVSNNTLIAWTAFRLSLFPKYPKFGLLARMGQAAGRLEVVMFFSILPFQKAEKAFNIMCMDADRKEYVYGRKRIELGGRNWRITTRYPRTGKRGSRPQARGGLSSCSMMRR